MARVPWGGLVLVLLAADAVSLWLFFDYLRDDGQSGLAAFALVAMYVILAVVAGTWAVRVAGGWNLASAARKSLRNERPDVDLVHALLALAGGVLIAWPGLVSDALGILLILPGTRDLARVGILRVARPPRPPPGPLEVEYRVE